MGETIAIKLINLFGWSFVTLGIMPESFLHFNDVVSLIIKVIAVGFLIVKLLNAVEKWLIVRVDRKEREDAYNAKKKVK